MIIGILGPGGCGGTFMDWTIQYLSGQQNSWVAFCGPTDLSNISNQFQAVIVEDPLFKTTSHRHQKTHPNNNSVDAVIDIFKSHPEYQVHSFYYVDSITDRTQTAYNQLYEYYPDVKFITYTFTNKDIDTIFCFQEEKMSPAKQRLDNILKINSTTPFSELPLWDQRELLSLYYPGEIHGQTMVEDLAVVDNNYQLKFDIMLNTLDQEIENMFQYLGLDICQERIDHWKNIYNQWKHNNNLEFFKDLDLIIKCILNNVEHDLSKYKMSFAKEVVIASHLLYKHNLALKSYQKNDLSQNTTQWSEIIEPNIYHDLSNIKGKI